MRIITNKRYFSLVFSVLILYLFEYIIHSINNWNVTGNSMIFDVVVFLLLSISYLVRFRKNSLLCFELLFLPVFFLGMFFSDLVLTTINYSTSGIGGAFANSVTQSSYILKARNLQMIAFLLFLIGCMRGSYLKSDVRPGWDIMELNYDINYNLLINILAVLLLFELVTNYLNGSLSTWFSYEQDLSDNERNQGLGHISSLCLISTLVEFTRLSKIRVNSLCYFFIKCNRLYIIETMFISFLLIISGNRNEMLLIFFPIVISYSIFIKKIPNKLIFLGLFVGFIIMIYFGLTRQGESIKTENLDIYTMTKDYSLIDVNCTYLIKYTDEETPHFFASLPASVLGGIPYFGPKIISFFGWDMSMQSTYITTAGLTSIDSNTGLGTSIVGDLYYNAKFPFVCLFMFLFGYLISRLHVRFVHEKRYNMGLIIIYLYMTSNAIYFVRQQWDFPIHDILYDYIIMVILCTLFRNSYMVNGKRCKI